MKTLFVLNPKAGKGSLIKEWPVLDEKLKKKISFDVTWSKRAGQAVGLVQKALVNGYRLIVAVGGDGSLNECLNGFLSVSEEIYSKAVLGVLPFGRGCDFARAMGVPADPHKAVGCFFTDRTKKVDVGSVKFNQSFKTIRYFLNIANVGLVPQIVDLSHRAPRIFGSHGCYLWATLKGVASYRSGKVTCTTQDRTRIVDLLNMVVANGRFFGAGMKIAPMAQMDDGLFEVLIVEKMGLLSFLSRLPKLYSGDLTGMPEVTYLKASWVELHPKDLNLAVEMDGDTVGMLPARFEILPKRINFKI